jgi:hypothetical protein
VVQRSHAAEQSARCVSSPRVVGVSPGQAACSTRESVPGGGVGCTEAVERVGSDVLAMRVLEVRAAYVSEEFEWDNCRRLAVEHMKDANVTIMRDVLDEAFKQDSMDDGDAPRD